MIFIEWFKVLCMVCFSTVMVMFLVSIIYAIARITFMVIQDYKEDREMRKIGKQQKHIDQR